MDLINYLKVNNFNYNELKNNCLINVSSNKRDINVFVVAKQRLDYLTTTLRYLRKALQNNITITLIEHDDKPFLKDKLNNFNIDYIFIPSAYSKTNNTFSRSLAFNCGHLFTTRAEWELHHDCDLLVNGDFFIKLKKYQLNNTNFIQPYSQKRVRRLRKEASNKIMGSTTPLNLNDETDYDLLQVGATGGSLLVRSKLFENVGGYDELFFYDYAPEDQMLWTKLECLHGLVDQNTYPHKGYATYANDVNLFHLDHGINHWNYSSNLQKMNSIYNDFCKLSYQEKLNYIQLKAKYFKEFNGV